MKKLLLSCGIIALLITAGCFVRSIHPLYTEKDLISDDSLPGVWKDSDEPDANTWSFIKEDRAYKLTHTDGRGNKAEFEVHLLQLGKFRFMDIYLTGFDRDLGEKLNGFGLLHLVPAHTFMRVDSIEKDKMELRFFNLDWLKKYIKENPQAIDHILIGEKGDEDVILTANTMQLQKFVLNNVEGDAFKNPLILKRANNVKTK